MGFVPGLFRQAAGAAYAPTGKVLPSDLPGAFAMGVRRPVGVVGAIAPWNAALILSARSIAAPLVFGNTVVLKPVRGVALLRRPAVGRDLRRGRAARRRAQHRHPRAAPAPPAVADELVENPARAPASTSPGSTATGRKLAEAAGRHLKRVVLELGGQNPLIVLADADLDYAVNATAFGAYLHQGQICMSARRIIVQRQMAEQFIAAPGREGRGPEGRRPATSTTRSSAR